MSDNNKKSNPTKAKGATARPNLKLSDVKAKGATAARQNLKLSKGATERQNLKLSADMKSMGATASPNLKLSDVMCPICLCILVEPVTMPCGHSLCMPCFNQHIAETSLVCPLCRLRISVWVRRSTTTKTLVNTKLWQTIKANYPGKVEARLKGEDDSDSEVLFSPVHHVSEPGEIRQEYEAMVAMEQQELGNRRSHEETASADLIKKFQDEEGHWLRLHQEQLERVRDDSAVAQQLTKEELVQTQNEIKRLQMLSASDEAVARQIEENEQKLEKQRRLKLSNQQRKAVTPVKGPMDVYIGQQTPRTSGKVPVSKVFQQSSDDKMIDTPHSSTSVEPTGEHGLGRQLREITSSQSSESDTEDMILLRHSNKIPSTCGKENRNKKRKMQPITYEAENCKKSCRTKNINLQCSPDIDSYSGERSVNADLSNMDGYPDETDLEESFPAIEMSRKMSMEDSHKRTDKKKSINGEAKKCQKNQKCQNINSNNLTEILGVDNGQNETESPDYEAIFSEEWNAESLASLVAEQKLIEEKLKQEEEDRILAEALQSEFNQHQGKINRRKGSEDEYALRGRRPLNASLHVAGPSEMRRGRPKNTSKSSVKGIKKQITLADSIAKHRKTV
ncbi:hypothetical protein Pcinc_023265 [Petrolisthes cinctipes]|uniref:RING-type E3 ubiquitin transferase n=1 Tax=Petrolisthes cinctipes TaxID=88211 RepID=A0AAE1KFJ2_PETCI|nr:hypothetical protein Pcinc_023265 [Petrolisthes cinctipes]